VPTRILAIEVSGCHLIPAIHLIQASPAHTVGRQDDRVAAPASLYRIRIKGRLGATGLSAFPSMACELMRRETVLTGWIEDQAALFGVLAQIEGLGLELLELRQIRASPHGNLAAEAEANADG
jgi:hypothetical protein